MPPRPRMTDVIDTALDRSILLGYGHPGLTIRRRLPGWPPDPPRMDGKVVLVTGAASGIGLAAARGFAELGATVAAVARSQDRAQDVVRDVREAVPTADVHPWACDVSSLGELRRFAARFAQDEARLDVLVNNAGVMPDERKHSAEGHELMFATHVLAPFALTSLLSEMLKRSAPARVINVSSGGMYGQALPSQDFESEGDSYGPKKLYARTKREQVVITEQWAERLDGTGVVVHAMHPGWVDTKGVQRLAAGVPPPHRAHHPHPRAGRRHDRVARWRHRAAREHRPLLARPARAPDSLPPRPRRRGPAGPPPALGRVRVGARRRLNASGARLRRPSPPRPRWRPWRRARYAGPRPDAGAWPERAGRHRSGARRSRPRSRRGRGSTAAGSARRSRGRRARRAAPAKLRCQRRSVST